jgi:hypothetical protein
MSDPVEPVPASGPVSGPVSGRPLQRKRSKLLVRMASIGASAQAAIPGIYAWSITVAPAAWSRGAPILAKAAAIVGVLALVTAPMVEGLDEKKGKDDTPPKEPPRGPRWARAWSIWGFVLSSAVVWALAPAALSSARLDGVRGALGMVGWALFAFSSAGPALQMDPTLTPRIIASTSLKPRSEIPRGDKVYIAVGVMLALSMQAVGWDVALPERAVLVRLVTVVCGIAVVGGTTSIALARHTARVRPNRRLRLRRALPWLIMLAIFTISAAVVGFLR